MKSILMMAAAGLAIAAAVPANAADVAVWRGATGGAPMTYGSTVHGVAEIRGVAASPAADVASVAPVAQPTVHISAGDARIWFYDAAKSRLTICRDHPTTDIGIYRLDCRTETLGL